MKWLDNLRNWVYHNLFDLDNHNPHAERMESFTNWLIISNLAALLLEHIPVVHDGNESYFSAFDQFSIIFFTIEYVLRLYTAPSDPKYVGKFFARVRHFFTPFALIDLAVIAPFLLHFMGIVGLDLRILRALRLLRLLKLLREIIPAIKEFRVANRGKTVRYKVNALMNMTPTSGRLQHQFDLLLIFFIGLSVICVFLETVPEIHEPLRLEFEVLDYISVAVFSIEFILRLYSSPELENPPDSIWSRINYLKKPNTIVDLMAVLPFYLQFLVSLDLRFVRILRVLRVAKLTRYNTAMKTFALVFEREKRAFGAGLFITLLITILGAAITYNFEHNAQPDKFDNMPRAMYWAIITLTSVGYGDISPITGVGQFFTMILSVLGIGIVALPAGILGSAFSDQLRQDREDMLKTLQTFLASGRPLTEEEAELLEEERIRLHLTHEQFDKLKAEAMKGMPLGMEEFYEVTANVDPVVEAIAIVTKAEEVLKQVSPEDFQSALNRIAMTGRTRSVLIDLHTPPK